VRWNAGLACVFAACQPWRTTGQDCSIDPPVPGDLVIEPLQCTEQLLPGGDGLVGADWFVATAWWRGVIRHPESSLTQSGVDGLTLIDAAPWGADDQLHELIPLVDGGWLHIDQWHVTSSGLVIDGRVAALPDEPVVGGVRRSVEWTFDPDEPWLAAEGANGWFIHPRGEVTLGAQAMIHADATLWFEGRVDRDLGGAVRVTGGRLLLDEPEGAIERVATGATIAGVTDGTHLELFRAGDLVARIPTTSPFRWDVPAIDAVRAVGSGSPSDTAPPSEDLLLLLGPSARVAITPSPARSLIASWSGREQGGDMPLPPLGGVIEVGAGERFVTVDAGFGHTPASTTLTLNEGETVHWTPWIGERDDDGGWVALGIGLPSDRSTDWRGSDARASLMAHSAGHDVAVFLVNRGTAVIDPSRWGLPLLAHGGTRIRGDGWVVEAWPVRPSTRKNSYGTVQFDVPDPATALQMASGGAATDRHLRVDVATLVELGPPEAIDLAPTAVRLDRPDDALDAWSPWFAWLDAGHALSPTGPVTWVSVADPGTLTLAEVDLALSRGATVASNGPRIELSVSTARPGDALPWDGSHTAIIHPDGGDLQDLWLVTDLGALPWPSDQAAPMTGRPRWALAVGLGPTTWAATGPIWFPAPALE